MASDRQLLISWVKDAYAMERAQVSVLENHARDAERFPEIRARDERHAEETRRHAQLLQDCLAKWGEQPSAMKSMLGGMMGAMNAVATAPFQDELVKNFVTDYAAESLEIASYRALIVAARELGEENAARTCEQILRDEESMLRWIEQHMPTAVRETLRDGNRT